MRCTLTMYRAEQFQQYIKPQLNHSCMHAIQQAKSIITSEIEVSYWPPLSDLIPIKSLMIRVHHHGQLSSFSCGEFCLPTQSNSTCEQSQAFQSWMRLLWWATFQPPSSSLLWTRQSFPKTEAVFFQFLMPETEKNSC